MLQLFVLHGLLNRSRFVFFSLTVIGKRGALWHCVPMIVVLQWAMPPYRVHRNVFVSVPFFFLVLDGLVPGNQVSSALYPNEFAGSLALPPPRGILPTLRVVHAFAPVASGLLQSRVGRLPVLTTLTTDKVFAHCNETRHTV